MIDSVIKDMNSSLLLWKQQYSSFSLSNPVPANDYSCIGSMELVKQVSTQPCISSDILDPDQTFIGQSSRTYYTRGMRVDSEMVSVT